MTFRRRLFWSLRSAKQPLPRSSQRCVADGGAASCRRRSRRRSGPSPSLVNQVGKLAGLPPRRGAESLEFEMKLPDPNTFRCQSSCLTRAVNPVRIQGCRGYACPACEPVGSIIGQIGGVAKAMPRRRKRSPALNVRAQRIPWQPAGPIAVHVFGDVRYPPLGERNTRF